MRRLTTDILTWSHNLRFGGGITSAAKRIDWGLMFTNPNEVRHASVQMQAYIWSYAEQLRQLTKQSLCCDQVRGAWHLYMLLSSCASPWWPETHRKRTYMWEYIICRPNMLYCTILYLIGLLYRHTIITSYNFDRGGGWCVCVSFWEAWWYWTDLENRIHQN